MKMGKLLLAVTLSASMMLSVAACGGSGSESSSSAGTSGAATGTESAASSSAEKKAGGEITFTAINGGDNEVAAFNEIIESFQKQSDVKVKLEEFPSSNDYENIIKTRFATNDPPDIFYFWSGANQYRNMKADSQLVDVTNEPFVNDLTDAIKSYQTVDGKIYGVPWGTYNALGVMYNKTVFTKLNLSLPKNYSDFLNICKTIKDAGITPIFEAAGTVWPTQIYTLSAFQSSILPTIGGDEGVDKLKKNQLQLKDIPALKDTFTKYYELNKLGYMNKDLASATYEQQQKALAEGTAAMAFQADWILPDINTKYKKADDLGYFPLPSENDEGVASLYPPKQIFISKNSKNVEGALEFMRFMTTTEGLNIWYKHNPGIPVYKSATSSQYAPQKDIMNYINANKGAVQIQLRVDAGFVDFDKICQELIMKGDAAKAVKTLNDGYIKDGKNKQLEGFK
ncbi:MAG: carbohydrate transporter substrate-binding protein [Eubacterium sp.]|jgi:ABC-type glycerol-3-phosphate transport system substrate-binding protein|nr:carbohydrate transporter substrate-binding protein [Eubacterium sp.]